MCVFFSRLVFPVSFYFPVFFFFFMVALPYVEG